MEKNPYTCTYYRHENCALEFRKPQMPSLNNSVIHVFAKNFVYPQQAQNLCIGAQVYRKLNFVWDHTGSLETLKGTR